MAMDFKAKVGPLPVWAWGGIVGAVIVAFMYFRPGSSSSTTPDSSDDEDTTSALSGWNVSGVPGSAVGSQTGIDSGDVADVEVTNAQWLTQGVKWAADHGSSSLTAQTALQRYLNGDELSASQASIVNNVLKAIGLPPQGVDTPTVTAPAAPAAPVNYATTTTASVPASVKVGQSFNVKVVVKANDSRAGTPTGKVNVHADSGSEFTYSLSGGVTNGKITAAKTEKDGLMYLVARYTPSGKFKASQTVRIPIKVTK